MIRLILLVSLRRWRSLPNAVIQGFSAALLSAVSLSLTSSVTNSRKGIPRSAAADLARRKMGSGISSVVFTHVSSHIYGNTVNRGLLFRLKIGSSARRLEGNLVQVLVLSRNTIRCPIGCPNVRPRRSLVDSVADVGANSIWEILETKRHTRAVARHEARGYASKILVEDRHSPVGDGRRHAILRLGNSACNAGQRVAISPKRYRVSDCIFEIR